MAKRAVSERGACIRVACQPFGTSEKCYRYERKQDADNAELANWLLRLTDNHRNWGFGLCYLYQHSVRGFQWNHKRVYRIYKELELNLRIKPRRRLVRDKPEAAATLALRYGVSESTVYKWKGRDSFHDASHTAHRPQKQAHKRYKQLNTCKIYIVL
jgi:putative transposase